MRRIILLLLLGFSLNISGQTIISNRDTRFATPCTDNIYDLDDFGDACADGNSKDAAWTNSGTGTGTVINEDDGFGSSYSLQVSCGPFGNGQTLTLPALTNGTSYDFKTIGKNAASNGYSYIYGGVTLNGVVGNHNTTSYTDGGWTTRTANGSAILIRVASDVASSTVTISQVLIRETP